METGNMGNQRLLACPVCGVELNVPFGAAGKFARCGGCQHRFQIPPEPAISEDDILSMINEEPDESELLESAGDDLDESSFGSGTIMAQQIGQESPGLVLIRLGRRGVLFEFPADRLVDPTFRCAMPRLCLRCGTRTHLSARVIIYGTALMDRHELHTLQESDQFAHRQASAERLPNDELLAALPEVPNVPPPANLPMPYWMCDMCEPEDAILGQVIENAKTGEKTCRLQLANPHRAQEFLRAAGGRPEDLDKLAQRCSADQEKPWDLVPATVRQRLKGWYTPQGDEHFLGYVPDRALSRTEEGMAGLIVSDRRLVYYSNKRHKEASQDQPITLELAMTHEQGQLSIETPGWKVQRMNVDREGIRCLRRSLTLGRFRTTWR